jgi:hypothetical protein
MNEKGEKNSVKNENGNKEIKVEEKNGNVK